MVRDEATWPRLEKYVKDLLSAFKSDRRVWVWDLYNEPGNGGLGTAPLPLVEKVFAWARQVDPSQPLTVGCWNGDAKLGAVIFGSSDLITFHNYDPPEALARQIERLRRHGRPLVCTEWMNRGRGSTVAACLPVFQREAVGCMLWGLVNGRTQTNLNWGHRPGQPDPKLWQHDLYRKDLTPYDPKEIELLTHATR
jgi:hypothetical protein